MAISLFGAVNPSLGSVDLRGLGTQGLRPYRADMLKIRTLRKNLVAMLMGVAILSTTVPIAAVAESDSDFRASQALRGEAVTLFRAGQFSEAADKMESALALRPDNAALLFNLSFLAIELKDADRAARYAGQYAALGLVLPQNIQDDLNALLPEEAWQPIAGSFKKAAESIGNAHAVFTVPTEYRLVEGIAADGSGTWFLSTVVDGKILRTNGDGAFTVLAEAKGHGFGSFFGIQYHAEEHALYATYGHVDQSADIASEGSAGTGLAKFDPDTGKLIANWSLPVSEAKQQIADITLTSSGAIFVTDAQANRVYRLGDAGLIALDLDAAFMSLQGLAEATDGTLLVADYGRGVWRVDPGRQTISLLGVPAGQTLLGIDGLFGANGKIYAVQNGVTPHRIIELILNESITDILDIRTVARNLPEFDEPTLAVETKGGFAVVASSQWPKFGDRGLVRDGETLNPTVVLQITTD